MSLIPARGRPGVTILCEPIRPLELGDLLRLSASGDSIPRVGVPVTKTLTVRHRRAAQLVALGKTRFEVAQACGYTPQRVTQLQEDPAFCELVAYFGSQVEEAVIDARIEVEEKLIEVAELALTEIHTRLEDNPSAIPTGELRQLATAALDRTIAPPKVAQQPTPSTMKVTFNMGPRALTPPTVEGTATEVATEGEVAAEVEVGPSESGQ